MSGAALENLILMKHVQHEPEVNLCPAEHRIETLFPVSNPGDSRSVLQEQGPSYGSFIVLGVMGTAETGIYFKM